MSTRSEKMQFNPEDDEQIRRAYADQELVADKLAGHPNFEVIVCAVQSRTRKAFSRREIWLRMMGLRKKKGGLPPKGKNDQPVPVQLSRAHEVKLRKHLIALGKDPDSLPYSEEGDKFTCEYRSDTGLNLSDCEIYRQAVKQRKLYSLRPTRPVRSPSQPTENHRDFPLLSGLKSRRNLIV